ncbi:MAG: 2Fe-2S iron-sulfur cluster-binding protein [Cardiobacteriaceae bacterium]|nr:2Fe-2S iron-sulfur cluster-binding protein [Cardiobacteriaceae bacterium]
MSEFHTLAVKDKAAQTAQAVTLTFAIPEHLRADFAVIPGQHVKLKTRIGDEEVERFYSVCAYGDDFVQVGIKRVDGGLFSGFACTDLKAGDTIGVMKPQGDFHLPTDGSGKNYCFLAAGSGITPIYAMIDHLLKNSDAQMTLIYVNASQKDIMFFAELEALKNQYLSRFSLVHVLTREPRDLPLLSARPEGERVGQLLDAFVDAKTLDHAYLCGPLPLIEQFREALLARGLTTKQVHLELFGTPASQQARKPVVHSDNDRKITVISQGREQQIAVAEGQNILDAALEAGANVPFACKGGVCATCKAKLLEGEADMAINYGLEEDEVAAGYILTCQAHVTTDSAIVDFDV